MLQLRVSVAVTILCFAPAREQAPYRVSVPLARPCWLPRAMALRHRITRKKIFESLKVLVASAQLPAMASPVLGSNAPMCLPRLLYISTSPCCVSHSQIHPFARFQRFRKPPPPCTDVFGFARRHRENVEDLLARGCTPAPQPATAFRSHWVRTNC